MKIYFIGGSMDLTCKQWENPPRWIRHETPQEPIRHEWPPDAPVIGSIISEKYKVWRMPDHNGREIGIAIYDGLG